MWLMWPYVVFHVHNFECLVSLCSQRQYTENECTFGRDNIKFLSHAHEVRGRGRGYCHRVPFGGYDL